MLAESSDVNKRHLLNERHSLFLIWFIKFSVVCERLDITFVIKRSSLILKRVNFDLSIYSTVYNNFLWINSLFFLNKKPSLIWGSFLISPVLFFTSTRSFFWPGQNHCSLTCRYKHRLADSKHWTLLYGTRFRNCLQQVFLLIPPAYCKD